MSHILVTGASGFVGLHVLSAFKDRSIRVILRQPIESNHLETVICDFEKSNIPQSALRGIKTIYHLAGIAHNTGFGRASPETYMRVNIEATIELARLAIRSKVEKFVFLSSVKAEAGYQSDDGNFASRMQQDLVTIYGETKRVAEERLITLCRNSGMHLTILRSPLVYGPNVKGNLRMMRRGIEKGWFPPIPRVNNRRSMIHVDDLVRALIFLDRTDIENCQIFNVTDGQEYTTREIYENMCVCGGKKVHDWEVPVCIFRIIGRLNPRLASVVDKLLSDEYYESKEIEALGYKPMLTIKNLDDSIFLDQHNIVPQPNDHN